MILNFLLISIILFFATIVAFGIFIVMNMIFDLRFVQKWRKNAKTENKLIAKNVVIKLVQIIVMSVSCIFIVLLPQIIKIETHSELIINIFYIPIIFSIGLIFSGWVSTIISICLTVFIVTNNAIISSNEINFFIATIFQIIVLLIFNISICIIRINKENLSSSFIALMSIPEFLSVYILEAIFFSNKLQYMVMIMLQTLIVWVLCLVIYQCLLWYYQFTNKVRLIDSSKIYENKYFLNPNIAINTIKKYIKNNNVNFGIIIVFDLINFNRLPNLWGNNVSKHIKNLILDDLVNAFKELNPFFFMTNSNEFACFINLKSFNGNLKAIYDGNSKQIRSSNDAVRQIQNCMLNLPKNISYQNKVQQIYAGAYAAIYGVHSYDLEQLVKLCMVTKQKSLSGKRGVVLDVYNPSVIKLINPIENSIFINKYFLPHNFQVKLLVDKNIIADTSVYHAHISCLNKLLLNIDEIKSFAYNKKVYNNTLRMIGMQVLKAFVNCKNFRNSKIIIDYPINFVTSEQFNLGEFKTKLQTLNLQPENIILSFDLTELEKNWIDPVNLINIRNIGIKIIFTNITKSNLHVIHDIKPDFICLYESIYDKNTINKIAYAANKLNIKLLANQP